MRTSPRDRRPAVAVKAGVEPAISLEAVLNTEGESESPLAAMRGDGNESEG